MVKRSVLTGIRRRLASLGNRQAAYFARRFFKTGPGQYGEGDRFRGVRVPVLRKLAREFSEVDVRDAAKLLTSSYHEDRLLALILLVRRFAKGDEATRRRIYRLYLRNTASINSWDLVDVSAEHIVGAFLWQRARTPLFRLARSPSLWERRISIMATFYFIRRGEFRATLRLAQMLLADKEDLIHKAVGWMLREIGKRDQCSEELFLRENYRRMPRVMLRYAIERHTAAAKQRYLRGEV
jgi:3-methyladenine DNA glycosylase AlkD